MSKVLTVDLSTGQKKLVSIIESDENAFEREDVTYSAKSIDNKISNCTENLVPKENLSNYYTKEETDSLIANIEMPVGDMEKSVYDKDGDGIIDKANMASHLEGINQANVLSYYGKNSLGEVGFHIFPINNEENKVTGIHQRVKLNAKAGEAFTVNLLEPRPNNDIIVQALEFKPSEQNISKVLKEFNNGDENNFVFNENNLIFDGSIKIITEHAVNTHKKTEKEFESEVITLADFEIISSIIGGVL